MLLGFVVYVAKETILRASCDVTKTTRAESLAGGEGRMAVPGSESWLRAQDGERWLGSFLPHHSLFREPLIFVLLQMAHTEQDSHDK